MKKFVSTCIVAIALGTVAYAAEPVTSTKGVAASASIGAAAPGRDCRLCGIDGACGSCQKRCPGQSEDQQGHHSHNVRTHYRVHLGGRGLGRTENQDGRRLLYRRGRDHRAPKWLGHYR